MFVNYYLRSGKKTVPAAFFLVLIGLLTLAFSVAMAGDADAVRLIDKNDVQHIFGRWVRPDGGYMLDLKEIGKDGTLKAAYFNPNPINVYRAELGRKQGAITIFVELRDVNYPGSTYNLIYDPETDRLVGTYFQAVQKVTFNIEFMRSK
jgi:uncharacterized protein (DUF2147 family)